MVPCFIDEDAVINWLEEFASGCGRPLTNAWHINECWQREPCDQSVQEVAGEEEHVALSEASVIASLGPNLMEHFIRRGVSTNDTP